MQRHHVAWFYFDSQRHAIVIKDKAQYYNKFSFLRHSTNFINCLIQEEVYDWSHVCEFVIEIHYSTIIVNYCVFSFRFLSTWVFDINFILVCIQHKLRVKNVLVSQNAFIDLSSPASTFVIAQDIQGLSFGLCVWTTNMHP